MSTSTETTIVDLDDRLSLFQVSTHAYKDVDGVPVLVDLLIPKELLNAESVRKQKRPIIIRIHGGFLIAGQREFLPWVKAWMLELALKNDAIVINADYRLLPEATTDEILNDMDDLWTWVCKDLQNVIQELESCQGIDIDLDKVLLYGDSAGGYLAIQTAIAHFNPSSKPRIRMLVAGYPMLDFRSPYWTTDYPKQIFDAPQFPNSFVNDFLMSVTNARKRSIVCNASVVNSPRMQFAFALVQRGRFLEVLGTDRDSSPGKRRLHPEDRIVDGSILPPALFVHGANDSAVPVAGTQRFVELLRKHNAVRGEDEKDVLKLVVQSGDHGFDSDLHIDSEEWLKESIPFIEKHWLK